MKHFLIAFCVYSITFSNVLAQQNANTKDWLLLDLNIQIESNDAINQLYNFKFDEAQKKFNELKSRHPKHPLAYFLLGLSEYWKIMPNENNTSFDKSFHNYLDSAIILAEDLYEKDNKNYEAAFFLTASYGFKGKLNAIRTNFIAATGEGRKALKFLHLEDKAIDISPEFLFGEALYNYYREDIYQDYYWLRPLIWAASSKKGNKELGIKQLNEVALNAFYTRTEAQAYLLDILVNYEKDKAYQALPTAKYLHETYPDNPYFAKMYAKITVNIGGQTLNTEKVCADYINKYNKKYFGYEDLGLRSMSFYLARIYYSNYGQKEKSKHLFNTCVSTSEKLNKTNGYYIYSLQSLLDIYNIEKDYPNAKICCEKILKHASKKSGNEDEAIAIAKAYLKELKKAPK